MQGVVACCKETGNLGVSEWQTPASPAGPDEEVVMPCWARQGRPRQGSCSMWADACMLHGRAS